MNDLTKAEKSDETFTEIDKTTGELVTYCIFTGELVNKQSYSKNLVTRYQYTPEIGDYVADQIRTGYTITDIAKRDDMPDAAVIYRWRRRYPDFARKLVEAREDRAEYYADKAVEVLEAATDKDDVSIAKEQAKVYQWHAERSDPKSYGKKSELKIEAEIKAVPMYVIDTGINRDPAPEDEAIEVDFDEVDND